MWQLVSFKGEEKAVKEAKVRLRDRSRAYYPLDANTVLVTLEHSPKVAVDRIERESPGVEVIVLRVYNQWASLGQNDLTEWLHAVGDSA